MWQIVITGPGYLGARYDLPEGPTLLGRADDCDVALSGDGISRKHAVIDRRGEEVTVRDLGSRNGTGVNKKQLRGGEPKTLVAGDEIAMGEYVIRLEQLLEQERPTELATDSRPFVTLISAELESLPLLAHLSGPLPRPRAAETGAGPLPIEVAGAPLSLPAPNPQHLVLLYKAAERLAGTKTLSQFLTEVADVLSFVTHYELCAVLGRRAAAPPAGASGSGAVSVWEPLHVRGPQRPGQQLFSARIVDQAIAQKSALLVEFMASDPRYNTHDSVIRTAVSHVLCLPLLRGSEILGAVWLSSRSAPPLTRDVLEVATALGHLVAVGLERQRAEERARTEERIRRELERYHHKDIVDRVVRDVERGERPPLETGMEDRVATILFADLAGFTPLTERLEPRAVAALLNDFYRRMTEVIFRWGGTIDKFIGDAVMALFGAPVSRGDDPVRAVRCALAMREELEKMMAARPAGERCGLTVGIHTGRVLVGTVGSDARLEFTAIGDPVNTAARLQASAEAGQIVISQETLSQVGDRFHTRSLGERSLKGKDRPVVVHEVIEEETDINTLPGNAGAVEAARTRKDT